MKPVRITVVTIIATILLFAWAMPLIAADTNKVNINSATKDLLMTLDGVGETYADRIIAYRETNGNFQTATDILKVKGIGEKTYKMNKDRIVIKDE